MGEPLVAPELVRDVDLLCLDAGNTVIFLDHARVVRLCEAHGVRVSKEALIVSEGDAKRAAGTPAMVDVAWPFEDSRSIASWRRMVSTMLARAGAPMDTLGELVVAMWHEHTKLNLWSVVPDGLAAALAEVRKTACAVVVVSNSEGTLAELFETLGIRSAFDLVIDSQLVGIEKPDPRIFERALTFADVPASRALHLGDTHATDILGARAANIRVGLVDPFAHYEGLYSDVPRVPGAVEVARAIAQNRR